MCAVLFITFFFLSLERNKKLSRNWEKIFFYIVIKSSWAAVFMHFVLGLCSYFHSHVPCHWMLDIMYGLHCLSSFFLPLSLLTNNKKPYSIIFFISNDLWAQSTDKIFRKKKDLSVCQTEINANELSFRIKWIASYLKYAKRGEKENFVILRMNLTFYWPYSVG